MAGNGSRRTGGRIHPHQRDADVSGVVLGADIVLDDEFVTGVYKTEQYGVDVKTKRKHRNAIK